MGINGYTDSEAGRLMGRHVRMIAEGDHVPRGTRGIVERLAPRNQGFDIVVNWEVNPMFVAPVPIQAVYSKAEFARLVEIE